MGIAEAPTGDGEVIGVSTALHPDLSAILNNHVRRAESITVRDVDTFGIRGRNTRGGRLEDVRTGEAGVVAGERHRAGACRAGDVTVDAHRARASDVRGHRQVDVGAGDLQGRASGHVDGRIGGQDGGTAELQRASGEEGAVFMRVDAGQDEVASTALIEADEAETACAIGEDTRIGGFNGVREIRHTHGGGVGVGDGGRIGALGDLDEVLAEAVQVDRSYTVDAQLDFRRRQNRVVLAEAKGAFAHVEQRVVRTSAGRVQENRALTDRWLSGARDEVAGQGEVTGGDSAGIVDGREEIAARGDARVEGDATRDRGDVRARGQHDDARAGEAASRMAIDDDVIGHRDAGAEFEAGAAITVGARLSRQRDGTAREAERIEDLDVTFSDGEVTGDFVVDQGGQDETAVTGLRQVSGARDGHGWVERTTRANIKGDGARHRDGRAGGDCGVRGGGQGRTSQEVDRPGEAEGANAATEFQGGARLDSDQARQGRAGQDRGATEDTELTLGHREVTFGDDRAIDGDGVAARLGEREARQFEGDATDIPSLRTADGGISRERESLNRARLREVRVIDDSPSVTHARASDGHRPAKEVDVIRNDRPRKVEGTTRRHGDSRRGRTEGTVTVNAQRAAINEGRTGVGVDGRENEETRTALREVRGRGDDALEG